MIERQLPAALQARRPGQSHGRARAYLGNTVYRIHSTNAPETIGHAVSSG
jgi:lipoprotein-anchoring transpeptidase ErfK/SrfK